MFGLTRYNNDFDLLNSFRDFENNFFSSGAALNPCKTDIREEEDKYILEAEMPGFNKEDIRLDLNGDYLVLTAEHSETNDEKDKKGNYIRRERSYGSYQRSFNVAGVNTDAIDAEYKNGVLMLTLPKKTECVPSARRLEIK
ncbi:MAG: Hsp20/alpha crystallin family protein [Ruminiclostridium sp.]